MPIQSALATQAGYSTVWIAALQNTAGSSFTMFSPIRISMGAAMLNMSGNEQQIYKTAMPLAVFVLLALTIMAVLGGIILPGN